MEYTWKIKFYMKSGSVIRGEWKSESNDSSKVFMEIFSPFDKAPNRYTVFVKSGENSAAGVVMNEVEAVELFC